jgi:NitT/TauT family transport system permease protein
MMSSFCIKHSGDAIMKAPIRNTYAKTEVARWATPNYWDILALILVLTIIVLLGWGAKAMTGHYQLGQVIPISLNPIYLPYYALMTVLRMFVALIFSLLFTFIIATWAAKSRHAERIIIPIIDILQSVPVLGFLSITIVAFIVLFRGSLLGPESAAIFAVFTAQVWNMALSFYQSLKTVPKELEEASEVFHLSAWQRFWRVEVPFAMPGLLWNTMMSMSGSWVFLVAAEAIDIGSYHISLPGIGSYIALAILHQNKAAIIYVIITMFLVIALYDQLLFRPLVAWAEKFKAEQSASEVVEAESWVLDLFQRTSFFRHIGQFFSMLGDAIVNFRLFRRRLTRSYSTVNPRMQLISHIIWNLIFILLILAAALGLFHLIFTVTSVGETLHVFYLGFITALRVAAAIIVSSIIWVPIGVWIGMSPRASQIMQPIAQFFAAFPANLLFPLVVMIILKYNLNINIWTSPLMILGTQWYILFNVIAGTMALPKNLHQAVSTLNLRGWLWWKRLVLPGIFPYYITGAITAAGGAWNVSIIAEYVSWGHTNLIATGLGAYIQQMSKQGDFANLALGIVVMSLFVVAVNRFMWRPLYNLAQNKFRLD